MTEETNHVSSSLVFVLLFLLTGMSLYDHRVCVKMTVLSNVCDRGYGANCGRANILRPQYFMQREQASPL